MLALKLFEAHLVCLLDAYNLMSTVLIGQNAINAKLKTTLVTVGLDRLHISDMSIAELRDYAKLVDQGLVAV